MKDGYAASRGRRAPGRPAPEPGPDRPPARLPDEVRDPRGQEGGRAAQPQPARVPRADREARHGVRDRPRGHRQDLSGGGAGRERASSPSRSRASSWRGPRWRRGRSSASCPATCRRRSIPTCGRSTTRSTTCSTTRRSSRLLERNAIEVAPIAFMRGRTLNDAFVIIDEAQNTTTEQMKMVLTRIGFGSKVVITGDITQIDLPAGPHLGPGGGHRGPERREGDLVRLLRREGRRAPQARAVGDQGLRGLRRRPGAAADRRAADAACQPPALGRSRPRSTGSGAAASRPARLRRRPATRPPTRCACPGEVALVLTGDAPVRAPERAATAGKDKPTDVLSFPGPCQAAPGRWTSGACGDLIVGSSLATS